jgi:hypothetical protein
MLENGWCASQVKTFQVRNKNCKLKRKPLLVEGFAVAVVSMRVCVFIIAIKLKENQNMRVEHDGQSKLMEGAYVLRAIT